MAEAAALLAIGKIGVALEGEVWKVASSLFENEVSLLTELPCAMSSIRGELSVIQATLRQMDAQTDNNEALEAWVKQVRKLAYDVEDIMDDYVSLIPQQKRSRLGDKNDGSRIVITTRSIEVASLACDSRKLKLEVLQTTEAWDLFCKKAFSKEKGCPEELKELGENIVSKCDGVSLAIVSLGSIMSLREKTKSEWAKVYDQLNWELHNNPNLDTVKLALNLGYNDLPRYLKNCFLHCSMFPKDHVLQRKKLMRLWVAEGLAERRGSRTLEEVAEDYLEEPIKRCMLQVVKKNIFGRIKSCRMNDVVRELAISLSEKENFSTVLHSLQLVLKIGDETRRPSVHRYKNEFEMSMELPRLRSFIVFDPSVSLALDMTSLSMMCSYSRYLTLLDLQGISIERVPDQIGDLFNLRFLGLRGTRVKVHPKSLGKLCNLQMLDLVDYEIDKLLDVYSKS
uniref:Disease resistance protein RPM1-like n=1 Tax=Elaeis guineensis var. tenera TaxID=51953 RepID=A0A8N4IF72_ELAGV|nr:disease resistance protein RPM1-like [Elaeis guineensis]